MQQRVEAWHYLDRLAPEVALVQEAPPPPPSRSQSPRTVLPRADEAIAWRSGPNRRWGSAVVAYGLDLRPLPVAPLGREKTLEELYASHARAVELAEVTAPDGKPLILASVYGVLEDRSPTVREGFATTSMHRILSDLTPLMSSRRGQRMILGGDLNIDPRIPRWGRHHELVIERIEAFGFVDALREFHGDYVQTHRAPNSNFPWQNDWIFVSKPLKRRLRSCAPVDDANARELSNHYPVIASLEFG